VIVGDVIPFKRKTAWQKHKGSSLCRDGFHKWKLITDNKFDSRQGKLVCVYKCQRCDADKTEAK
tara:strand:- start:1901 stop:2092 length:192 start_codon:yes stop_codon:yes gene_type:complete